MTIEQEIKEIRKQIYRLQSDVGSLQTQVNCKSGIYFASHTVNYYDVDPLGNLVPIYDTVGINLLLNDKLPQTGCFGNTGLLVLYDVVVIATYTTLYNPYNENSGWQVWSILGKLNNNF